MGVFWNWKSDYNGCSLFLCHEWQRRGIFKWAVACVIVIKRTTETLINGITVETYHVAIQNMQTTIRAQTGKHFQTSIISLVLLTLPLSFMACKVSLICQLEREGRKCWKLVMSDSVTDVLSASSAQWRLVVWLICNDNSEGTAASIFRKIQEHWTALKMDIASFSYMLVPLWQSTWRHVS